MKEVTYEDWQKNPTPRMMWVWDSNENAKQKRKVIYFLDPRPTYLVVALTKDKTSTEHFRHCAEIEEQRRMTNQELAWWLRKKPTREWKYNNDNGVCCVCCIYGYREKHADKEIPDSILIREDGGEWREPLVEVEE